MPDELKIKCKQLESICVVDAEGRARNLELVLARGLPTVQRLPKRAGKLALVASGPSVREHLDELREWDGEVWAINGAYDYLIDQSIIPQGFVALDPLPGLADYVRRPQELTTFYIASTCDVSVFDALKDHKVQTFHPASDDVKYPEGSGHIGGGTTTVTRAPYLGLLQGWREIVIFGSDSSYDGGEYCYEWGRYACDIANSKIWIDLYDGGPCFQTEIGLMKQVSQLQVLADIFRDTKNVELTFRCGGLLQAYLQMPAMDDSIIEVEKDGRADAA